MAALGGGPTPAEVDEAQRVHVAREALVEHRGVNGDRRLTAEVCDRGHFWEPQARRPPDPRGRHRGRAPAPARQVRAADISTATAPDLVARQFTAPVPNRLWVEDITYRRTWEEFIYLAVVVDARRMSSARHCAPRGCWPRWAGSGPRSTAYDAGYYVVRYELSKVERALLLRDFAALRDRKRDIINKPPLLSDEKVDAEWQRRATLHNRRDERSADQEPRWRA
ncbi:hypothetical protein [Cellulomonas humilata]|uniref:Transposase InsO family protein n=1 Tax=Cellulomonas humilata TaxID=144055 RepID=A0ABU0EF80_9CELL|nr:hypothetical protein [Cellulomonas humilata]MDQ0373931.1 transposase InsO family protein [Cellulomonas humilata]